MLTISFFWAAINCRCRRPSTLCRISCSVSDILVNSDKTKVVVFSVIKSHPAATSSSREISKIVDCYTYPGVVFSSNGKFQDQVVVAKSKVFLAAAQTLPVLVQLSCLSRSCKQSLFEATICFTFLYAATFGRFG